MSDKKECILEYVGYDLKLYVIGSQGPDVAEMNEGNRDLIWCVVQSQTCRLMLTQREVFLPEFMEKFLHVLYSAFCLKGATASMKKAGVRIELGLCEV